MWLIFLKLLCQYLQNCVCSFVKWKYFNFISTWKIDPTIHCCYDMRRHFIVVNLFQVQLFIFGDFKANISENATESPVESFQRGKQIYDIVNKNMNHHKMCIAKYELRWLSMHICTTIWASNLSNWILNGKGWRCSIRDGLDATFVYLSQDVHRFKIDKYRKMMFDGMSWQILCVR